MYAFLRAVKNQESRNTNQTNNRPVKQQKRTHAQHEQASKASTNTPKWLPEGCFGESGTLLGARSAPRGSHNQLRSLPGAKKISMAAPGRQKTFIAPGPPQGAGQGPGGDRAGTGRGPGGDRAGTGLGSGSATQGFRDPGLATFIFHFEGCRKEGREDEHEDENANKTAQQNMKNTSKNQQN